MQRIKQSKAAGLIGVAVISLCSWLWYTHLNLAHDLAYANWLAVAMLAIVIFSPLGNIKLCSQSAPETAVKKLKFWQLQVNVIILQACLASLLYNIYTLFNHIFFKTGATTHTTFIGQQYMQLSHYGLFPWPTIALLSLLYSYTLYNKKQSASLSTLLVPNSSKSSRSANIGSTIRMLINLAMRVSTISILGCVLATSALTISSWILQHGQHSMPHGKTGYSLIYMLVIFILLKQRFIKKGINNMLAQGYKSYQIITFGTAILVCVVVAISLLIPSLFQHNLDPGQTWLNASSWHQYWSNFSILWGLAWCSPLALWLAHKARGFSMRSLLLAQITLPAIACGALYTQALHHPQWMHISSISQATGGWQAVAAGCCMLIIILLFSYQNQLSLQFDNILHSTTGTKFRHALKPTYMLLFAGAGITTLFLQSGFCSLSFISYVQFIPVIVTIYITFVVWPIRKLINKTSNRKH